MTAPDQQLSGLARGGALNLAGAVAAGVSGIVVVAAVTNGYPAEVAGAFFAATSVFLVLGAACELGCDAGLVRALSRYLALHRYGDARRIARIALVPVFAVAGVVSTTVFAAAPWIGGAIADTATAARVAEMLRVLAVFLPAAALHNSVLAATRGYRTMRPTVLVERLGRPGSQVVAIVAAQALGGGPVPLAFAWSAPYLLGLVVGAGWLARLNRFRDRQEAELTPEQAAAVPLPLRELAAEFWRYTGPRAFARIFQVALQRSDIVLVAALSTPREAAIYTAATRFVVLGQLGTQAVQQVMQPTVSRLLAVSDDAGAARIFRVSTVWTMALTWPVFVVFAVAAPVYLGVIGSGYAAGQPVVVILALTMLLATAAGPVDAMLLMAGRSGLSLANNGAALAINVALNIVLVPRLGAVGAAVAWSAAITTRNALPLTQVRFLLGMTPVSGGAAWIAGSAAACFGMLPLLTTLVAGPRPLPFLMSLVPSLSAYAALAWVGRGPIALFAFTALLRRRAGADATAG